MNGYENRQKMKEIVSNPLVLLSLTLGVYFAGMWLQMKYKSVFLNPILLTMGVLIGYLVFFNISYEQYAKASIFIDFWLKPSIVALGVPLYIQLEKIKKQLIPLLLCQFAGSVVGIISVCVIAHWLGAERIIILSLAPKSVTTPIAIEIANSIGGQEALTAAIVILTGLTGTIFGFKILKFTRIKSPIAQGISLGTASHGMGIIAARRVGEKYAAFASLGLIFNGIFTALLAPYLIDLLVYFSII